MENPFSILQGKIEKIENQQTEILSLLKGKQSTSKKLLTKKEFAQVLNKSTLTINRWISDGKVIPIKIGSSMFFKDPFSNEN